MKDYKAPLHVRVVILELAYDLLADATARRNVRAILSLAKIIEEMEAS